MFLLPPETAESRQWALYDFQHDRYWSYKELRTVVEQTASRLRDRPKSLAFLFCRNNAACVIAYLAFVEAGHAVALLDEALPAEFKSRLIDIYQPEVILAFAPGIEGCDFFGTPEAHSFTWRRSSTFEATIHPDLSLLLSTSGSTGTPKFVRLTRANIEGNARSIGSGLGINSEERPITSLPLHYSYGLSVLNSHLANGAFIVLTSDGLMTPAFWDAFRKERCTSWAGVPYSYQILRRLNLSKLNIASLHTLTQAGGRLQPDLIAQFHAQITDRGGRFFVMYGQTEATARITILPSHLLPEKLGSVGRSIEDGTLSIETENGFTTRPHASGEVVYSGPNVMMGYATSRDDLSQGDTLGGQLRTGDIGYLDEDGCLFLTGRRKRDAKLFGMRVNMDEVEELIRVHGPSAVVAGEEKLVIFCETGDSNLFAQHSKELSLLLKLHIGAFDFRLIPQLPLNANGKVDYQTLGQLA